MKKKDYDLLKSVCEKEGFEIEIQSIEGYAQDFTFIAKKKDIWEGVGFGKVSDDYLATDYIAGKIYPVTGRDGNYIITLFDEDGDVDNGPLYKSITPSTESAYFEQLKKEAFERFGEIKVGYRFDESSIDGYYYKCRIIDELEFNYFKELDLLTIGEVTMYRKGKWAEKIKDRVNVDANHGSYCNKNNCITIRPEFKIYGIERLIFQEVQDYLKEQLEKYLNDEI